MDFLPRGVRLYPPPPKCRQNACIKARATKRIECKRYDTGKDICNIFVIAGAKEKEGIFSLLLLLWCACYLLSVVSVVSVGVSLNL